MNLRVAFPVTAVRVQLAQVARGRQGRLVHVSLRASLLVGSTKDGHQLIVERGGLRRVFGVVLRDDASGCLEALWLGRRGGWRSPGSSLCRFNDAHGLVDDAVALVSGHRQVEHQVARPPAQVWGVVYVVRLFTEPAVDHEAVVFCAVLRICDGIFERLGCNG